jgi:preprotein translocase subunit SecY
MPSMRMRNGSTAFAAGVSSGAVSGGALSRFTVFALGIMPYISASIIMQLLTYVVPTFEQLKKEGEAGRRQKQRRQEGEKRLESFPPWPILDY